MWIIQILPAVVVGLYTHWLHRTALLLGWAVGMLAGTAMAVSQNFVSVYPLQVDGLTIPGYAAVYSLILNIGVSVVLTLVFNAVSSVKRDDVTVAADYL